MSTVEQFDSLNALMNSFVRIESIEVWISLCSRVIVSNRQESGLAINAEEPPQ